MPNLDLRPATERMARLLAEVDDDALANPTPCPNYQLGDLIDHVGGFALAFTAAAAKNLGDLTSQPRVAAAANLEPGWRARITGDLAGLAAAWQAPDAWDGMTKAGGVDLPGQVAGRIALDELVVHGWDIARATGQPFDCDDETLREIEATVSQVRRGNDGELPGLFGPIVSVPETAPRLDSVLGLTGRDPRWSPA
jgi:uncharacterized protein (TIGR03086 family)